MISDVLSEAVAKIRDHYLTDEAFSESYNDPTLRAYIESVVTAMDGLRVLLDTPPEKGQLVSEEDIKQPAGLNARRMKWQV